MKYSHAARHMSCEAPNNQAFPFQFGQESAIGNVRQNFGRLFRRKQELRRTLAGLGIWLAVAWHYALFHSIHM